MAKRSNSSRRRAASWLQFDDGFSLLGLLEDQNLERQAPDGHPASCQPVLRRGQIGCEAIVHGTGNAELRRCRLFCVARFEVGDDLVGLKARYLLWGCRRIPLGVLRPGGRPFLEGDEEKEAATTSERARRARRRRSLAGGDVGRHRCDLDHPITSPWCQDRFLALRVARGPVLSAKSGREGSATLDGLARPGGALRASWRALRNG
jgi:hypothetical protein